MFGLSRKTDYALLIITALARRPQEFVSVRALSRAQRLPYRFASQILADLARAGILNAREGVKGGYRFAKNPASVSVADVLHATEKKRAFVSCLDPITHYACPQKAWCGAKTNVGLLERNLLTVLRKTTIADFLRAPAATASPFSSTHDARS